MRRTLRPLRTRVNHALVWERPAPRCVCRSDAPTPEQSAAGGSGRNPGLQTKVIGQQRCFVFAAQQVKNLLEVAQPAQPWPGLLGVRSSDLQDLAQHHRKCGDAPDEAAPSPLQAASLRFRYGRLWLARGFGVERRFNQRHGDRPIRQRIIGQHADRVPTGRTQETIDPFALGQFLAIGVAIISAMTMNRMFGIDRARWPVAGEK